MTDYPTHDAPDRMAQTDLDVVSADAANWRTLLAELTARGFAEMSLSDILVCFPDFQELALAHTGANPPDAVAAAKCDFLDTDSLAFRCYHHAQTRSGTPRRNRRESPHQTR